MIADIETLRVEVQKARDRGRLPGVQHAISGWNPGAFEPRELPAESLARARVGKLIEKQVSDHMRDEQDAIFRLARHIEATGEERGILVEELLPSANAGLEGLTLQSRVRLSPLVPQRTIARQVVDHFEDVTE